jgi:F0F1-type ATP synthase assembly protein I
MLAVAGIAPDRAPSGRSLRSAVLGRDQKGSDPQDMLRATGQYMGLGLTWALSVLFFLLVGAWVDSKAGTSPLLLVLGAFVGGVAGFYSLYYHIVIKPRQMENGSE